MYAFTIICQGRLANHPFRHYKFLIPANKRMFRHCGQDKEAFTRRWQVREGVPESEKNMRRPSIGEEVALLSGYAPQG